MIEKSRTLSLSLSPTKPSNSSTRTDLHVTHWGGHILMLTPDHATVRSRTRTRVWGSGYDRKVSDTSLSPVSPDAAVKQTSWRKTSRMGAAHPCRHAPRAATRAAALAGEAAVAQGSGAQAVGAPTTCMVGLRVAAGTSERHVFRPPPGSAPGKFLLRQALSISTLLPPTGIRLDL